MNKDQQTIDESESKRDDLKHVLDNKIQEEIQPELPSESTGQLSKLEEQLALEKDKYLRLIAEFENYKKRNLKERAEYFKYAGAEGMISILPVLDDLERAQQAQPLSEGIMLVFNKLIAILEKNGLKAMEAKGKIFDPDLHDAIANIPVEDETMKNKVVDEIEKGYYLHDKVIRHAKVLVGN